MRTPKRQGRGLAGAALAVLTHCLLAGQALSGSLPDEEGIVALNREIVQLYQARAFPEAIAKAKEALARTEARYGGEAPETAYALVTLSRLLVSTGEGRAASPLVARAVGVLRQAMARGYPEVSTTLSELALMHLALGETGPAESAFRLALATEEKQAHPDASGMANTLHQLARLASDDHRGAEAIELHRRALALREGALGPDHPDVASSYGLLADAETQAGDLDVSEVHLRRALEIREKSLGPDHYLTAVALGNLGRAIFERGRHAEARPLLERALALSEANLGRGHPDIEAPLSDLVSNAALAGDLEAALRYQRQIVELRKARFDRWSTRSGARRERRAGSSAIKRTLGLLGQALRTGPGLIAEGAEAHEALELVQLAADTDAADALGQMTERALETDPATREAIRHLQDIAGDLDNLDARVLAAAGQGDAQLSAAARAAVTDLEAERRALEEKLDPATRQHIGSLALAPVSLEAIEQALHADEALVTIVEIAPALGWDGEVHALMVIPGQGLSWWRLDLTPEALRASVAALRCGLDPAPWYRTDKGGCPALVMGEPRRRRNGSIDFSTLPFDRARAEWLYRVLLGPLADRIASRSLIVTADGALSHLPWGTLVSGEDEAKGPRWLATEHAITVLPALSVLPGMRSARPPRGNQRPFLGFANPLLDGPDPASPRATLARRKVGCDQAPDRLAEEASRGNDRSPVKLGDIFSSETRAIDVALLRHAPPLPETADEVCAIALSLGALDGDVLLAGSATEGALKRLSAEGRLPSYRVIHFATHGVLQGEIKGAMEPGLVLTPPPVATHSSEASVMDDGYLGASEAAALKLDADLVILSACNTAAGGSADQRDGEALSGLARAFLYAGARALLVSHWEVDSAATVGLVTGTFKALANDPAIGRAEALRRSMSAMSGDGTSPTSHPAYWAPFVLVGEGAAER